MESNNNKIIKKTVISYGLEELLSARDSDGDRYLMSARVPGAERKFRQCVLSDEYLKESGLIRFVVPWMDRSEETEEIKRVAEDIRHEGDKIGKLYMVEDFCPYLERYIKGRTPVEEEFYLKKENAIPILKDREHKKLKIKFSFLDKLNAGSWAYFGFLDFQKVAEKRGLKEKADLLDLAEQFAFAEVDTNPTRLLNSLSLLWDNGFRESETPQKDILQMAFEIQKCAYMAYFREVVAILNQEYL